MHVTSLHRYPIKGCRGRVMTTAVIDRLGIVGDRRLMLVDVDGRFISQRENPRLATIEPELDGPMLVVRHDGVPPLELELDSNGDRRPVRIWDSTVVATDQGERAAAWFSTILGETARLVHFGADATRRIDPAFSPRGDAETAFTDGYPLLGVLEESLADLNGRLAEPVPMARFRPNVVIRGADAWSEDQWRTLRIGDLTVDAVKPNARCVVTTTDQATGARHPTQEPLRTLAQFRTLRPFGAIFGQNLVPRSEGRIATGDVVEVAGTA
jgi:uncharacterized protein YcbX